MEEKTIIKFDVSSDCPLRVILAPLSDKWSLLTLATLKMNGKLRFSEIQRSIGDVSQRMLTVTLRSLEADGMIHRKAYAEVPPRVEYELTELGESLFASMQEVLDWANENMQTILMNRKNFKK